MANNRELSQFGSFVTVDESANNNVGIATTVRISGGGGLYVGGTEVIGPTGAWRGPNSGLIGAQGADGAQGAAGAQGTAGAQGAAGAQGSPGSTGAQGQTGNPGAQGSPGSTGAQGSPGSTGAQGSQGSAASASQFLTIGVRVGTATSIAVSSGTFAVVGRSGNVNISV